jgi:hypothetical protein
MENSAVMAMAISERTGYLYGIKKHVILMGFLSTYNWYNSGLNCNWYFDVFWAIRPYQFFESLVQNPPKLDENWMVYDDFVPPKKVSTCFIYV